MSNSQENQPEKVDPSTAEAEIQRLHNQWREIIRQLIEEKPTRFVKMLCQGVLEEPGAPKSWLDARTTGSRHHYLTVATLVIRSLTGANLPPPPPPQYVSLAQWIESDFDGTHQVERHLYYPHFEKANSMPDLVRIFFGPIIDALELSVASAAQLVYHGVPLYERGADHFELADDASEEISYLRQRGSRYETVSSAHIPEWADRYFFNAAHLKTYRIFFRDPWEQSAEEILQLRTAYRNALNLPPASAPDTGLTSASRGSSRLLMLLDVTLARYYGVNFLPSDASTWPRQKDVVGWLREVHGLSEREAQAIDIVCRPDALRGK